MTNLVDVFLHVAAVVFDAGLRQGVHAIRLALFDGFGNIVWSKTASHDDRLAAFGHNTGVNAPVVGQTAGTNAGVGGQTGVREDEIAVFCLLLGTVDGGFIVNKHGLHELGVRHGFLKSGRECFICGVPIACDMQNVRLHLSGKLDHLVGIVG